MRADDNVTSRTQQLSRARDTKLRALWEEKSEVLIKGPVIVGQTTSAETKFSTWRNSRIVDVEQTVSSAATKI